MVSAACSRAWVGGERCEAVVAVSWGCLYSEAVRSLCRVWMRAPRKWRRHSVGLSPAKAGLKMEHGSRAGLGGVVLARVMVGVCWRRRLRRSSSRCVGMYVSGIVVVQAACLLARRSSPTEAREFTGRVMKYLHG